MKKRKVIKRLLSISLSHLFWAFLSSLAPLFSLSFCLILSMGLLVCNQNTNTEMVYVCAICIITVAAKSAHTKIKKEENKTNHFMWHADSRFDIFIINRMEKYVNYYTILTGFSVEFSLLYTNCNMYILAENGTKKCEFDSNFPRLGVLFVDVLFLIFSIDLRPRLQKE